MLKKQLVGACAAALLISASLVGAQEKAKAIELTADKAELSGDGIVLEGEEGEQNIGCWNDTTGVATWQADVPAAGTYRVEMLFSLGAGNDGSELVVTVGGKALPSVTLKSTGDWTNYQGKKMGEVKVEKAGKVEVTLKSTKKPGEYIANVRTVVLASPDAPSLIKGIKQESNGTFKLTPENAVIEGAGVIEGDTEKNIGCWSDEKGLVTWPVEVKKAGTYKVELNYSLDASNDGNELALTAGGGKSVPIKLVSTEDWATYKTISVGTITFDKAETTDVVVKCTKKPGEYVMNIREVKLTPAAK